MAESTSGYRERNSTADRALTILQMFTEERTDITAVEVADTLGVARSTAYRYLQTLVQSNFLSDTGRGGFRLGLRILDLGRIARKGLGLADMCVPVMRDLAERFNQTVLLTKLMGNAVVCIEREEARDQYVRLSYERGSILDINAGASALVLLAGCDETKARTILTSRPLHKFTENTLTEPDEIISRLLEIRADGYGISAGEVDPTAMGIAAPILRPNGDVIAAISVVLIRRLMTQAEIDAIVRAVVEAAADLTSKAALLEL